MRYIEKEFLNYISYFKNITFRYERKLSRKETFMNLEWICRNFCRNFLFWSVKRQHHNNNELFDCVWPYCEVGVKGLSLSENFMLSHIANFFKCTCFWKFLLNIGALRNFMHPKFLIRMFCKSLWSGNPKI